PVSRIGFDDLMVDLVRRQAVESAPLAALKQAAAQFRTTVAVDDAPIRASEPCHALLHVAAHRIAGGFSGQHGEPDLGKIGAQFFGADQYATYESGDAVENRRA